jgi:hypothetical protein
VTNKISLTGVVGRLRDHLMKLGRRRAEMFALATDQGVTPYEVSLSFSSAGYLGAMSWWLESDMPYTPEEMARYVTDVAVRGVFATRGWELPS